MPPRPRRAVPHLFAAALVRAAPFVLGAVAAAIWLRRRQAQRAALPVRAGAEPPSAPPAPEPASGQPARTRGGRFERRPIDIVTVVDDLLGASR
jgi:hypothetical protein